jgi:signal transduction histidine kinase
MTSLRRALGLVALEGVAAGIVALALFLASDHNRPSGLEAAIFLFVGWSFVGTGLFAWWRRPESRFGLLMAAVGFAWFLGALVSADDPWLFTAGVLLANLHAAVFAHMLLAYPDGRLQTVGVRRLVAAAYVLAILGPLPYLLFGTNADLDCACPRSPLFITGDGPWFGLFDKLTSVLAVALVCWIVSVLVRRWRTASASRRRDMGPVVLSGIALLGLLAASLSSSAFGGPAVLQVGMEGVSLLVFTLTPYGFLFGLLHSRVNRAGALSEMLRRMGEERPAGTLRDQLADALGDPSLEVAYWFEDRGMWLDADGHAVAPPAEDDPTRASTEVGRRGRRVGVVVHDRALCEDDPGLLASVMGAAGLALENERLQAQLRARVEELEASRARLVEATTAERRRLERNLHDGAQQRLVALSLTLRLAQGRVGRDDAAGAERLLGSAQDELRLALEELRELARGIHPAVLSDRGLGAALEALAGRSPVPVALEPVPPERLPAPVEAAAYFVVSEALTNVAKYADASQARVCVSRSNGSAVVEIADDGVGGADPRKGSGLKGLADRISALDGRLDVRSSPGAGTVLRAEIPVMSERGRPRMSETHPV